jgi:hypothetical protein
MRRSAQVFAPILASAAVSLLAGCGPEMQRCVDQQNHVVDTKFCQGQPSAQSQPQGKHSGGYIPLIIPYRYYYGGSGGYGFGSTASGGSFSPASGHSYSLTSGTSRGGFGSSFSGGHGEGGGE